MVNIMPKNDPAGMNRRQLLLLAAVPMYAAGPFQTFSPDEARLVEALAEQVVPADDAPGAKQAGVLYYIDRQLAGPLSRFAPIYHESLPRLAAECRKRTDRDFVDLPFAEQTRFLQDVEAGLIPNLGSFFRR